jgi:hypothetical protein
MNGFSRRDFVISAAGAAMVGPVVARAALADDVPWRAEKVVDCHYHGKPTDAGIIAHLDGAGISNTLILSQGDFAPRMASLRANYPGRVLGWSRGAALAAAGGAEPSAPPAAPGARLPMTFASTPEVVEALTREIKAGAKGFGEVAGHVSVDGPELQRVYALAAEFRVPILMHFQEVAVPGQPRYGISGFSRIEPMLKKYPKTHFICHASDFWGHIDARYKDGGDYPSGKVVPGGLADRLLSDYANMHGDLSAPSGLIQLARDPAFTSEFLARHSSKLIFGSDCGCDDGRGSSSGGIMARIAAGTAAAAPPGAGARAAASVSAGLARKCIARELLTVVWNTTPRPLFRKLVWENAHRTYKIRT